MPSPYMTLAGRKIAVSALHKLGYACIPNVDEARRENWHEWQTIRAKSYSEEELAAGSVDRKGLLRTPTIQAAFNASREQTISRYHALPQELRVMIMRRAYDIYANDHDRDSEELITWDGIGPPCILAKYFLHGTAACASRLHGDLIKTADTFGRLMEWQPVDDKSRVLRYIDFNYPYIYADYLALMRQLRTDINIRHNDKSDATFSSRPREGSHTCAPCFNHVKSMLDERIAIVQDMFASMNDASNDDVREHLDKCHNWEGDLKTGSTDVLQWTGALRNCLWGCDGIDSYRIIGPRTYSL